VQLFSSILVFLLFSSGLYMVMRRSLFEVLLGMNLLSHGANLFLITMGGWSNTSLPPILMPGEVGSTAAYADPIPQALILTAIVISFGVTSFLVVLIMRGYEEMGTMDMADTGREGDEP